jgi:hypothetical protein
MRRMSRPCAAAALVLVAALAAPLAAHHSIAAVYDRDKRMTLSAVVKQWRFVNPHPSIVVEVAAAGAPLRQWTFEMDNRWELVELGFTENTLKPGDRIEITGDLSRREPHSLYVRSLRKPSDGFRYDHHP